MRVPVVLLAILLAGCSSPGDGKDGPGFGDDDVSPGTLDPTHAPDAFDHLTQQLAANSTAWQEFLLIEDEVAVGNASIQFTTGRGMGCQGDADNVSAGQAGWVACAVRLAARPEAVVQAVRELGIGYDAQRLTARQAAEPIEWRVVVILENGTSPFDSGWRAVDLSPGLSDPVVTVDVRNPCDGGDVVVPTPDLPQVLPPSEAPVDAILRVEFDAHHGRPFVAVDLGAWSRAGDATSTPFAGHGTMEHAFEAQWDTVGFARNFTLELAVDIKAGEPPTGPTEGPCEATIGRETQEWIVDVGVLGADGAVEYKTVTVLVDVYVDAV